MAGQKSTIIEYAFRGDTLDLQQAIKKVSNLISNTTRQLKKFQDGSLTASQKTQIKALRDQLKVLRKASREEGTLTEDRKKKVLETGRALIKQTEQFAKQTANAKIRAEENAAKEEQRLAKLTTVAGKEAAIQKATYLDRYADKFKHTLSTEAYDEIKRAVADFNVAIKDSSMSQEELGYVIDQLLNKYKDYRSILHTVNRAQQQASRSILSMQDLLRETQRQVVIALKSFAFWLKMARKIYQLAKKAATEYLSMLDALQNQKAFEDGQATLILQVAESWKALSQQLKLFMHNIGGTLTRVLEPIVKLLTFVLMVVNSLMEAFSGLSSMMGALDKSISRTSGNLASFDSLNILSQKDSEDEMKSLLDGYKELEKTMKPLLSLFQALGRVLNPIFEMLSLPFDTFLNFFNSMLPVINALLVPVEYLLKGLGWLLQYTLVPIIKVIETITSNIWLLITALSSALLLFMAIKGITFYDVLAKIALGFVKMASSIWTAITAIKNWIVLQVKSIATSIRDTVVKWWQAKAYWKLAIASIAAAGALAAVIAGIVLTATAAANKRAKEENEGGPRIPALAKGGVVNTPTLSLIGEGRYSEAVVPLGSSPQFRSMKEDIASRVAQTITPGSSLENATIKVFIGTKEFTSFTYDIVSNENRRRTGVTLEKASAITRR